jgi:hypothetical protein
MCRRTRSRSQTAAGIFAVMVVVGLFALPEPKGPGPHPYSTAYRIGIIGIGSLGLIVSGLLQLSSNHRYEDPSHYT